MQEPQVKEPQVKEQVLEQVNDLSEKIHSLKAVDDNKEEKEVVVQLADGLSSELYVGVKNFEDLATICLIQINY